MKIRFWALAALAWTVGGAAQAQAQRPPRPGGVAARGPLVRMDVRIGQALDRRYELALDDEQVRRLDALRVEARSALEPLRSELSAAREAMRDGSLPRLEARERLRRAMQSVREGRVELRGRFDEILRPQQRMRLRHSVGMPGARGEVRLLDGRRRPGAEGRRAPSARRPAFRGGGRGGFRDPGPRARPGGR